MEKLNLELLLPILIISLILVVISLVDLFKSKSASNKLKLIWTLIIIITTPIGPVLYFVIGRRDR